MLCTNCDIWNGGNYSISIETENPELIFSYIGYTSQTVVVNGRTEINITLREESHVLNEVVVTAMGIMRKEKSLTYATQQIKSEDLNKVQDPNVANSVYGVFHPFCSSPWKESRRWHRELCPKHLLKRLLMSFY